MQFEVHTKLHENIACNLLCCIACKRQTLICFLDLVLRKCSKTCDNVRWAQIAKRSAPSFSRPQTVLLECKASRRHVPNLHYPFVSVLRRDLDKVHIAIFENKKRKLKNININKNKYVQLVRFVLVIHIYDKTKGLLALELFHSKLCEQLHCIDVHHNKRVDFHPNLK